MGLEGTAALRALMNLVMPVAHAIGALSLLLMPLLARYRWDGQGRMQRTTAAFLALFLAAAGLHYMVLLVFRHQIMNLYGGQYPEAVPLVPLVALLPFLAALISVWGAALKALERPVAGALGSLLLSSSTTALIMLLLCSGLQARRSQPVE